MADDLHTLVVGREAMACRFEVACNAGEFAGDTELAIEALDLVDRIEDRISIYRPDSELSRINALAAEGWVEVATDIWPLLARSRELWELTGGAFDIAAGALVRAWGFLRREGRTPDDAALAAARASTEAEAMAAAAPAASAAPRAHLSRLRMNTMVRFYFPKPAAPPREGVG
jgi:thiamine biosynthesis lipoprotein ApbE